MSTNSKKVISYVILGMIPIIGVFHVLDTVEQINSTINTIIELPVFANTTKINVENQLKICLNCDKKQSVKDQLSYFAIEVSLGTLGLTIRAHSKKNDKSDDKGTTPTRGNDESPSGFDDIRNGLNKLERVINDLSQTKQVNGEKPEDVNNKTPKNTSKEVNKKTLWPPRIKKAIQKSIVMIVKKMPRPGRESNSKESNTK